MIDFLNKYVLEPIYYNLPYNPVNTSIYILIFFIVFYLVYKGIQKLEIQIDQRFLALTFPFIILGTFLRFMVDIEVFPRNIFTVTPGIWIETLLLALILFYLNKKKIINDKILISIPSAISIILFLIIIPHLKTLNLFYHFILLYFPSVYLYLCMLQILKINDLYSKVAGVGQILDASAAIINIFVKGYIEEHYFTSFIIYSYPQIYLAIKIFLPIFLLIFLKDLDQNLRNLILFTVFVLGFGPGLRNFLLMLL